MRNIVIAICIMFLHPMAFSSEPLARTIESLPAEVMVNVLRHLPAAEIEKSRLVCRDWDENIRVNMYHDQTFQGDAFQTQRITLPSQQGREWFERYVLPNPRLKSLFYNAFAKRDVREQWHMMFQEAGGERFLENLREDDFWLLVRGWIQGRDVEARHKLAALLQERIGERIEAFDGFLKLLGDHREGRVVQEFENIEEYVVFRRLSHKSPMDLCCSYMNREAVSFRFIQALEMLSAGVESSDEEGEEPVGGSDRIQPELYSLSIKKVSVLFSTRARPQFLMMGEVYYGHPAFTLDGAFTSFTDSPFMIPLASLKSLGDVLSLEVNRARRRDYMGRNHYEKYPLESLRFYESVAHEIYKRSGDPQALRLYEHLFVPVLNAQTELFLPLDRFQRHNYHFSSEPENEMALVELYFDQGPMKFFDQPLPQEG